MTPMGLLIRALYVLAAIAVVVLVYLVTVWVLGMLGVPIPMQILKVLFVIIGILFVIAALTGRFDNWWRV